MMLSSLAVLFAVFSPSAQSLRTSEHASYKPQSVADAWQNHADAFGSEDLDKIMLDYTENSIVEIYDQEGEVVNTHKGLAQIRSMFANLFETLGKPNPFTVPVDPVIEEPSPTRQFGQVFLLWEAASKGFPRVTDTFVYSESFKIIRQNIVTFPKDGCPTVPTEKTDVTKVDEDSPVQKGWENHFEAFGGQDLDKIMLDYNKESKAMVYDNVANDPIMVNEGTTAIKKMFRGLFADLSKRTDLAVPLIHTSTFGLDGDQTGDALGMTFLIWRSPADRYAYVTDTFVYNKDGVILRQNIVAMKKDPCAH